MAIDPNWARWIRASINDHFVNSDRTDPVLGLIPMFFEGQVRSNERSGSEMELRLHGPHIHEVSKNYYKVIVEPSVILQTPENESDMYAFDRVIGLAAAMFDRCIAVFKYGPDPGDDDSYVFGLQREDSPETLTPYGKVNASTRIHEGSVSATYVGYITVQE